MTLKDRLAKSHSDSNNTSFKADPIQERSSALCCPVTPSIRRAGRFLPIPTVFRDAIPSLILLLQKRFRMNAGMFGTDAVIDAITVLEAAHQMNIINTISLIIHIKPPSIFADRHLKQCYQAVSCIDRRHYRLL